MRRGTNNGEKPQEERLVSPLGRTVGKDRGGAFNCQGEFYKGQPAGKRHVKVVGAIIVNQGKTGLITISGQEMRRRTELQKLSEGRTRQGDRNGFEPNGM